MASWPQEICYFHSHSTGDHQSRCLILIQRRLGSVSVLRENGNLRGDSWPFLPLCPARYVLFRARSLDLGKCPDIGLLCSDKMVRVGAAGKKKDHFLGGVCVFPIKEWIFILSVALKEAASGRGLASDQRHRETSFSLRVWTKVPMRFLF